MVDSPGGGKRCPGDRTVSPDLVAEPAVEGLTGGGEELERRAEIIGLGVDDVFVILILGWPESPRPYPRGMAARKRSTREDAATARRLLLDGLARDADIDELLSELAPLHPRDNTFPGEVLLRLAADALAWCGASRADPLDLEGIRERFLPECTFRGRQNKKLQYAVLVAAALRGGTDPDLLDEVAWWQTDDFWQYALFATVAYIRAAASRAGVPVRQVCQDLAQHQDHPAP